MPKESVIKKSAFIPTALIAGGAGFIGSYLAESLLLQNTRVIVLDNFKTGDRNYLNHLLENPKFALYDVDINQGIPPDIESVDYIFHLAGLEEYLFRKDSINLDSLLTNAFGTKVLLDLAQKSRAKFLFGSSIYVYEGMMSQVNLQQYFGTTNIEEKRYSLAEAKRFAEALIWEYYKKNNTDVRIVRLPEVFGPKMDLESGGEFGLLIKNLLDKKDLTVSGDGSEKEHYLYITDVVSGLIKALFTSGTAGKIYSLVGKEPYSILEVTFLLKSVADYPMDIQFKSGPKNVIPNLRMPDTSNLNDIDWEVKISFKEGIIKTLKYFGYEVNEHSFKPGKLIEKKLNDKAKNTDTVSTLVDVKEGVQISESAKPKIGLIPKIAKNSHTLQFPKLFNKFTILPILGLLIAFVLIFILLPAVQTTYYTVSGAKNLAEIPSLLQKLDGDTSKQKANKAYINLSKAQSSLSRLGWLFSLVNKHLEYESVYKFLRSATYFSKSAYYFSKASIPFSTVWLTLNPSSTLTFNNDEFSNSYLSIKNATNNLQLSEAEFKNIDAKLLPKLIEKHINSYQQYSEKLSKTLDISTAVLQDLPDALGNDRPKKYLILFENPNEIRPTGGFIGSYALLEMTKGKITNLIIDDIYNPDGQLDLKNIRVQPPAQIINFLSEDRLNIRNANWNPSFPDSAETIKDLYYKATGDRVDGVVAVDLYFVQNLLKVTGPIFLTAYNEEINSQNLYERTQFHSEFNYIKSSDQKKTFLTVLGSKLLEKVFALPSTSMPNLITSLTESLNENHILIYLSNNPLSVLVDKMNWGGSLMSGEGDYLYVVNANLGGTKANYYVKNKMSYDITSLTRDGNLRASLTLDYTHTGTDSAWPGGPYTDYLRVLTQQNAKLTGATIKFNDKEEQDIFSTVVISKVKSNTSFETSFVLNPKESVKVIFYYDLPQKLWFTNANKTYSLSWQKQPGTEGDEYNFSFTPPFGFTADQTDPNLTSSDGTFNNNGILTTNKTFKLTFK